MKERSECAVCGKPFTAVQIKKRRTTCGVACKRLFCKRGLEMFMHRAAGSYQAGKPEPVSSVRSAD